jgi:lipoprotein-releasing system permease protein
MQLPIALKIGLRYSRSRKGQGFLSFITMFSITGIFLGVMALTIVTSVMNGFESKLKDSILGVVPHVVVRSNTPPATLMPELRALPTVQHVSPYLHAEALLQAGKHMHAAQLQAVTADGIPTFLKQSLVMGEWSTLFDQRYHVLLGTALADQLNVGVGEQVRLILPAGGTFSPLGWMPRQRQFTVAGLLDTGSAVDQLLAVVAYQDLMKFLPKNKTQPALGDAYRIQVQDAFQMQPLRQALATRSDIDALEDWRDVHGKYFAAVAMEKTMMWLMLLLIVAVAAFNIVSALVMMVTEKQREVAILKTQGMRDSQLFAVFAIQGMSHGVIGALSGVVVGVLLCWQLNPLLAALGLQLVPGMDLPVQMQPLQIMLILTSALFLTALAVIYPAWRAVRVDPATILRDE